MRMILVVATSFVVSLFVSTLFNVVMEYMDRNSNDNFR
jgi:hypothetical protein